MALVTGSLVQRVVPAQNVAGGVNASPIYGYGYVGNSADIQTGMAMVVDVTPTNDGEIIEGDVSSADLTDDSLYGFAGPLSPRPNNLSVITDLTSARTDQHVSRTSPATGTADVKLGSWDDDFAIPVALAMPGNFFLGHAVDSDGNGTDVTAVPPGTANCPLFTSVDSSPVRVDASAAGVEVTVTAPAPADGFWCIGVLDTALGDNHAFVYNYSLYQPVTYAASAASGGPGQIVAATSGTNRTLNPVVVFAIQAGLSAIF